MSHRAVASLVGTLALGASLVLACGGDPVPPPPPCPFTPPVCPDPVPSYAAAVAPVIAARCAMTCHRPGGIALTQPLTTYPQIFLRRGAILGQVARCRMPPIDEPPLSLEEGGPLLDWLACGAPNN